MKRGRKSSNNTFTENGKKIWKCGKYKRLSKEDGHDVSYSIENQELICRGWFLPPNTYDCGSFVVNGTAVVGKESKIPYNRCKSHRKELFFYEIYI